MSIEISPKRIKVLLLEDNPRDAEINLRELRRAGFDPDWVLVETEDTFLAALNPPPDLILSDLALPQFDGLRAVDLVRGRGLDIPFILISGTLGEDVAINSMKRGVDDYLLKSSLVRLGSSVVAALDKRRLRDEQRKAEDEKRRAEERLRLAHEMQISILNALPAHIAVLDSHGVIVTVNEAWRRFASANVLQSADFYVGQNYLGVCESAHGECATEAQAVAAGIRKVLSGEVKEFGIEYPCHSPNEQRWFRMMATPLTETPVTGAVVMHVNVTERRLAEEILSRKEREQRRLAEELTIETQRLHESQAVANIGSWETDLATLEVVWTDETFHIFETSPEDFKVTHHGYLERIHPADRQRVDDAFKRSIGQPGSFVIEHRLLFPDGRIKFVEERWQVFNDATGRPVRAVGTCQDITKRKLSEESIRVRARQQEAVARLGFEATKATSLELLFDFATRAVAEALEVELCKVLQLSADGSHMRLVSGVGWQTGLVGVGMVGVDHESQAGFTLMSDGPIYVNDFAKETRFKAPPLLKEHGVVSGLSVTIQLRDKPWGVLGAHSRTVRQFDGADAGFMQSVATLLAVVIERLAVQRVLSESERQMREAQRIASLGSWELDLTNMQFKWSDEVYRIFGLTPGQFALTDESLLACIHPEDRDRLQTAKAAVLAGHGPLEVEHRMVRPDGVVRHVRERGELIRDERGTPIALTGTVLDITEATLAEETLRKLSQAVEQSPSTIIITDLAGNIEYVNPRFTELTGYSAAEVIGKNPRILKSGENPPELYRELWATITAGKPWRGEMQNRKKTGETYWDQASISPVLNAQGKITHFLGVKEDISERRAKEAQLRLLEMCVSRFNDIVLITEAEPVDDPGPRILYVNDAFVRRTGFTREEVIGKSPRLLQGPKTQRDALDRIRAALQAWQPCREELINYTKSGEEFWLELDIVPVADATGWFTHWVAIERDITERKKMEKQLLRTQRLESVGTLAGGIAHDLNNALAPIMMSVQLLQEEYPAESRTIDIIGSSAKHGADMVRQLLTFAKGAEGERVILQPGLLIRELENLMKGSFPKNIQLVVKYDSTLPTVLGDATQLHQVLLNLCVNARDAMPHGGTLTLEAQSMEMDAAYARSIPAAKPGNYLLLRVRDTGTGIPSEILDRIFDPFFSTKGPDKGTGLGLSTVMGIVKGHGGFLQVYSQPGQGSTFTVYLHASRAGSATEHIAGRAVEFRGQGESILLVDDEANMREIARTVLRRLNFNPLTASDGADGIIQAAEHRTKLRAVITDLHMPNMDGLAFVRALRRMLPDIPIIVASGRMEDELVGEFKALGVTSRMDKPYTEAQLAEALRNLLSPK